MSQTADTAMPATINVLPTGRMRAVDMRVPEWLGLAAIAAFLIFLTVWGLVAPLSSAAIATGSLTVEGRRQAVQHPYGGVVRSLLTKDGDHVAKGQTLMVLSDSEPRANLDVLISERDGLLAEEARLIAERDGEKEPDFSRLADRRGSRQVEQTVANELAMMAARARQEATATAILKQKAEQLRQRKEILQAQVDGIERQRGLVEEEAKGARQLLASGFAPKPRVLALERSLASLDGDRDSRMADMLRNQDMVGEAELQIAAHERDRLAGITDRLRQVQIQLSTLGSKISAAEDVLARTTIQAPATGEIVGSTVHTEGGVIKAGDTLFEVVPSDNRLVVDARLPVTDIDQIKPGMPADVRLTSINRNERPNIRGEVTVLSADRMTEELSGRAYYPVKVVMNADDVRDAHIKLKSGMAVEAVIATQSRTLFDYLLGPLIDELTRSFRER